MARYTKRKLTLQGTLLTECFYRLRVESVYLIIKDKELELRVIKELRKRNTISIYAQYVLNYH